MTTETMTDEELDTQLTRMLSGEVGAEDRVRTHIAALTAERDLLKEAAPIATEAWKAVRDDLRERVDVAESCAADKRALAHRWKESAKGLRERVQALEAENKRLTRAVAAEAAFKRRHRQESATAEARLSGILQRVRAEDSLSAFVRAWEREQDGGEWELEALAAAVASHIVPKAERCPEPAFSTDGGEHSLACPRAVPETCAHGAALKGEPCDDCSFPRGTAPEEDVCPEPSTAEAFAGLRDASRHSPLCAARVSGGQCDCGAERLLSALSLLERRMGEFERYARASQAHLQAQAPCRPPGFTIEEVERVLSEAREAAEGDVCLSTWCTEEVVPRLTALRPVAP